MLAPRGIHSRHPQGKEMVSVSVRPATLIPLGPLCSSVSRAAAQYVCVRASTQEKEKPQGQIFGPGISRKRPREKAHEGD